MQFESGTTLGWCEIRAPLGAGGMGEVYRALDHKLGREVALKFLPEAFARDPVRLERFEREARAIAAINHPNVATIHGVEEAGGVRFLVLELVDGETLSERPYRGRPPSETLQVALQIAEALEAAHDKGVIHRDLKPDNVKVTAEGRVKVLDFGLAKMLEAPPLAEKTDTETETAPAATVTAHGQVVGTPRYMSPEQAAGERLDPRTDIWSFGAVLWELLAGAHLFEGSTTEVLAAILRDEPDWTRLRESTPPAVRHLLRRCLTRNRHDRLQAIGEARIALQECLASPVVPTRAPRSRRRNLSRWAALFAAALAGAGLVWIGLRPPTPVRVPRLTHPVQITAASGIEDYPTWSPDGRTLAYESDESGRWDIWVAQVGGGAAVNRTAGDTGDHRFPSWSPDGTRIAFLAIRDEGSGYYVLPALGGDPQRASSRSPRPAPCWERPTTAARRAGPPMDASWPASSTCPKAGGSRRSSRSST